MQLVQNHNILQSAAQYKAHVQDTTTKNKLIEEKCPS